MSKYAITIGSSQAYWMGLNATLNALDYYGVKDIDVYVHSNSFMKEYFDFIKDKFNFSVFYVDTATLDYPFQTNFADDGGPVWREVMYHWGKYPLFYKIKDKYDAIMHLDADMMVVDDLSDTFKEAAETGKLLIAGNDRSSYKLDQITEPRFNVSPEALLDFCKGFEVLNYVMCFDAKKYVDLIDYTWALRNNTAVNIKHYGLETAYFVEGIYKCNLLDKVTILPFKYWVSDDYLCKNKIPLSKDANGKYHLISPDGNNIKVTHSRYWNVFNQLHAIELTGADQQEVLLYNIESHMKMTDFLNYDWKVKLNDVLELNQSYKSVLNLDRAWTIFSRGK